MHTCSDAILHLGGKMKACQGLLETYKAVVADSTEDKEIKSKLQFPVYSREFGYLYTFVFLYCYFLVLCYTLYFRTDHHSMLLAHSNFDGRNSRVHLLH